MVLRIIIVLSAILLVVRWLVSIFASNRTRSAPSARAKAAPQSVSGDTVKALCGTRVASTLAVPRRISGEKVYCCSDNCPDCARVYAQGHPQTAQRSA